jgi:hypothetical protein
MRRFRPFAGPQSNRRADPEPTFCVLARGSLGLPGSGHSHNARISSSRQLGEERLGVYQIGGVETFGEPAGHGLRTDLQHFCGSHHPEESQSGLDNGPFLDSNRAGSMLNRRDSVLFATTSFAIFGGELRQVFPAGVPSIPLASIWIRR